MYILFNILSLPLSILLLIFIFLFFIANYFINYFTSLTNTYDSKHIVIDELLGIFTIFLFYDLIFIYNEISTFILIFFVFRFFDIMKFFPANYIDKNWKNGFGVILDDIVAGVYVVLTLIIFMILKSKFF